MVFELNHQFFLRHPVCLWSKAVPIYDAWDFIFVLVVGLSLSLMQNSFQMMAYARDDEEEEEEERHRRGRARGEESTGRWRKKSSELLKSDHHHHQEHTNEHSKRWKNSPQQSCSAELMVSKGELAEEKWKTDQVNKAAHNSGGETKQSSRWSRAQTISSGEGVYPETLGQKSGGSTSSRWKRVQQSSADLVRREERRREDVGMRDNGEEHGRRREDHKRENGEKEELRRREESGVRSS